MVVAEGGATLDVLCKNLYTLIEQSVNSRITCMQHSQENFMRIVVIKRIMGKISSIIGAGLVRIVYVAHLQDQAMYHYRGIV